MKKNIILILAIMMLPAIGNAQLGGLLEKAAKKAVNKTTEKLADKAADRASEAAAKAIEGEVDKRLPKEQKKPATAASTAQVTYESLMRQLPELPSADHQRKYCAGSKKYRYTRIFGKTDFTVGPKKTSLHSFWN